MRFLLALASALACGHAAALAAPAASPAAAPARHALTPFGSEQNLESFFTKVGEKQRRERLRIERHAERRRRRFEQQLERLVRDRERLERERIDLSPELFAREIARLDAKYESVLLAGGVTETVQVSAAAAPPLVTNLQEAGVDEGGLVKRHGDHLIILRRGRLLTIAIGEGELRAVASIDAFDPRLNTASDGNSAWYDELLLSGDTVAVLGYSYVREGTEIGLFDIDAAGGLQHRATYHLRSSDYYSAENSASRLIGSRLLIYTSSWFDGLAPRHRGLPELRKWNPSATDDEFQRIPDSRRVYRPVQRFDAASIVLHTVTSCDLARVELTCEATVVMAGPQVAFYVSPAAVYIWAADVSAASSRSPSMLYRIPIDGTAPRALRVRGAPFNQFSFLESEDRYLNVVIAAGAERERPDEGTDVAFLRIALDQLADGSTTAPRSAYTRLGRCRAGWVDNRFIGSSVLVSCSSMSGPTDSATESAVSIVRWATGKSVRLTVPLSVARIEPMGLHALLVGPSGGDGIDLRFASIRLDDPPMLSDTFTIHGTSESESRSHAFAYLAGNATDGLLALPVISRAGTDAAGEPQESAAIVFLRSRSLMLEELGVLTAEALPSDDACRASCVDWYGDARPLFVGSRIFALLGYEIVEGTMIGGRLTETARETFAPQRGGQ
jgi:hypothetical protein